MSRKGWAKIGISSAGYRAKHKLPPASKDLLFPAKRTKKEAPWTMTEYIREFERLNGLRSA